MAQLLYVIGVGGVQVGNVKLTQFAWVFWQSIPIVEARKLCNFSWQRIKHAQYSAPYIVLPHILIKQCQFSWWSRSILYFSGLLYCAVCYDVSEEHTASIFSV
jgi:hypothetical protein